jgi:uncharacterized protein YqgC (DUF456 family)
MEILLWVVAVILVALGIAGVLLPALPVTVLIFAGLALAAWADGFTRDGAPTLVIIAVLGVTTYFV